MSEFNFIKINGEWHIVGPAGHDGEEVDVKSKKGIKQVKLASPIEKIVYSIAIDDED